jgi:hypothetical protein
VAKICVGTASLWTFECVLPKFIAIPPEYNNPRYLPREVGLLDTESGRLISI